MPFQWSDAWLLHAVCAAGGGRATTLASVVAAGDYINHAVLTAAEIRGGVARLVAAGHVVASVAEAGASLPLIRDGKLRALAVTSATRFPTLPEVPPIGEAVGMPELEAVSWHVIFARHDTPRDIVNRLHDEMKSIMAAPDMQEKIMRIGLIPHDTPSVEGVQRYIKAETEKWGTLVRQLGLEGSQ